MCVIRRRIDGLDIENRVQNQSNVEATDMDDIKLTRREWGDVHSYLALLFVSLMVVQTICTGAG